jgi:hypothetical protein
MRRARSARRPGDGRALEGSAEPYRWPGDRCRAILEKSRSAKVMTAQQYDRIVATSVAIKPVMGLIEQYRVPLRARCVLGGNARCT